MEESALLRACRDGNTLTVRTLLQHGAIDVSAEFDHLLFLSKEKLALLYEYGQQITSKCRMDCHDLIAYLEQDLSTAFIPSRFGKSAKQMRSLHHLLRYQGRCSFAYCNIILSWLFTEEINSSDDPIVTEETCH